MSLRNRARSLQRKTGLSYQQALARLRALGQRPATLSRQTGWPLEVCDRFLVDGHAPIDVVELPPRPPSRHEQIVEVCEILRATSNASAVVLADASGRVLAHVGERDHVAFAPLLIAPAASGVWELEDGTVVYTVRFERGVLVVRFHRDETSLGLVRLRCRIAVEELERLLAGADTPSDVPPGGRGGPGGLPAEVRVVEETRAPPAEPRPAPIGRRRRR